MLESDMMSACSPAPPLGSDAAKTRTMGGRSGMFQAAPSRQSGRTGRETEVLALMAEGRSNTAIAGSLFVTEKAIGKHTSNIFAKLDLPPDDDDNRRVLAVVAYLQRDGQE